MQRSRYRRIVLFFARVILSLAFWDILLPRLGLKKWSRQTRSQRLSWIGVNFRALAIHLGGVLIKIGQFLSARVDVLPDEITRELAGLQDQVPAEDPAAIRRIIEQEFGEALEANFLEFEPEPEAAASLGQVHRARMLAPFPEGTERYLSLDPFPENRALDVVVKVQRPGIEQLIATDLAALRTVGGWLKRYPPIRRRADVPALLAEFTRILNEETDYLAEGRNAEIFAENFQDQPGIRVPAVVWSHTTRRVLTLEDVQAIKITDYAAIEAAGIDRAQVAERLFHTYLQQIFEDSFFHADPHPGNLFVAPLKEAKKGEAYLKPEDWLLTFVDFGMVGRIPPHLRTGLRELVIATGTRDSARMVKAYQQMGILLPEADLSLLQKAEDRVFEQFWGRSMSELQKISPQEIAALASEFRTLLYNLPFQVPEDMILLGRSIGILSGMCTGLNPDFNVWEGLAPYAMKLISQENGGFSGSLILEELKRLLENLLAIPRRVQSLLDQAERGELVVRDPHLVERLDRLENAIGRASAGLIGVAAFLAGVQLFMGGHMIFGEILMGGAGLLFAWLAVLGIRAGRRK
jgi:predicted unusual protein kinase regulating ubiquinone biosynthesis (AarF/ABC1/UbiB family)